MDVVVYNRNLLLVTFSYLRRDGGGIESWLQKFLSNINLLTVNYDKIYITGLDDGGESFVKDYISCKVEFILIKAHFHSSFLLFPLLVRVVGKLTKKLSMIGILDTVYIGSNFSAFPILFSKKNRTESRYIWLRSFFPSEIVTRKMNRLKKLFLKLEYLSLKKADKLIANGFDTERLYSEYYTDLPEIITIPNAVDKNNLYPNEQTLTHEKVNIAFVGRLEKIKGFDCFCKSIILANKVENPFVFYIVGAGRLKSEALVLENKYKNVKYIGQLSNKNVYNFLSKMDCTVNLTVLSKKLGGSGLSNSLLESVFSRNLIIAWDNILFTQLLDDSSCILVPQENIVELVNSYNYILDHRNECIAKVQKAEMLSQEFDFEHHMIKFSNTMLDKNI